MIWRNFGFSLFNLTLLSKESLPLHVLYGVTEVLARSERENLALSWSSGAVSIVLLGRLILLDGLSTDSACVHMMTFGPAMADVLMK